jgi:chromate transport protein ChrA
MPNKSDKGLVATIIVACTVIIAIFHFAWAKYLFMNYGRPLFAALDIILLLIFSYTCYNAYKNADDPNKDWQRWAVIIIAVLSCIWAAAWSTGLMNNIDQGV